MKKLHVIENNDANGRLREEVYNPSDHNATWSCKMFQSQGIPCRHILCVLKGKGLTKIPSNYIVNRWTKLANRKPIFDITNNDVGTFSKSENEGKLILDAWGHFFRCMDKAGQHKEKLLLVMNEVVNIAKQLAEYKGDSKQTKTNDLQTFVGSSIAKKVGILPP
ncbi:hypothetical protein GYH30_024480 [Glycine max]|uniref:Protein FAR1-RELATED SEQUENCE n=2 Tax=Glycine subgen. Soja TaxID=1462606 RepID=K7LCN9_SOYBN|nr:hypothetical protein GYH30_024480 [Glycine max]RZB91265.1 hypothetical protein D0Y65_023608 [Glycine soja]